MQLFLLSATAALALVTRGPPIAPWPTSQRVRAPVTVSSASGRSSRLVTVSSASRRSSKPVTMSSASGRSSKPGRPKAKPVMTTTLTKFPAASHRKTRNQWRETSLERNATRTLAPDEPPSLQTGRLPPPSADGSGRIPTGCYPALVLNADYTPLSYVPLSLWSWQDSIRAVCRDAVIVLSTYEGVSVRSPSVSVPLPSVIVLKNYVPARRHSSREPLFTRRNLFLRDKFCCQYCRQRLTPNHLTYDHVVPRARQGTTTWENIVTSCSKCNVRKGSRSLKELPPDMQLRRKPHVPTWPELHHNSRSFPPKVMHRDWALYLGCEPEEGGGGEVAGGQASGGEDDWGI